MGTLSLPVVSVKDIHEGALALMMEGKPITPWTMAEVIHPSFPEYTWEGLLELCRKKMRRMANGLPKPLKRKLRADTKRRPRQDYQPSEPVGHEPPILDAKETGGMDGGRGEGHTVSPPPCLGLGAVVPLRSRATEHSPGSSCAGMPNPNRGSEEGTASREADASDGAIPRPGTVTDTP